jgi:hypothetical protein
MNLTTRKIVMVFKRLFQKSDGPGTSSHNKDPKAKASAPQKAQSGKTTEKAIFDVEFAMLRLALVSPESPERG